MVHQTDSGSPGSSPPGPGRSARGPALAILATAPRPGLVLQELCPPLRPAEAGALQTAWLKQIAQELPGIAVFLFGRPTDALPMLRYFAGPGVELREWRPLADAQGPIDPRTSVAGELFAAGYGPVLVRSAEAPEPGTPQLQACAAAVAEGAFVWAPDQRGAAWLVGCAEPRHAVALHLAQGQRAGLAAAFAALGLPATTAVRRGPWARTVRTADDLALLLHERDATRGPPELPVRNLQAALAWYEAQFGTELLGRDERTATLRNAAFELRLVERGPAAAPNGLWLCCDDPRRALARFGTGPDGATPEGPEPVVGGGIEATVTDLDGNRLTLGTPPPSP